MYKKVNGKRVPLTQDEINKRLQDEADWESKSAEREYERTLQVRRENYPDVRDQLDAILKYLKTRDDLTPEIVGVIHQWEKVKLDNPKK
jgi:hypothetical protein